ncbi:hypothetical protein DM992_40885 (plasmid) [Burkholderia sp. JP2-270]|uniref:hypothetical protein n=1 Tax=Burkholderia sp. JP2-270 TaxID=2217913 RepID=UPI000DA381DB|nr:hypothetical protein [Burkholderia sp. JP2-270]AWV05604.1 hypothetical protein DM992_40885 [Burkholderia sp. JP2-270]
MAASEVAVAASEVAKVVAQAPTDWLTPALIGTIFGAVVTAGAGLWSQHRNRQHELAKIAEQRAHEAATLAEQRAPAQLDVARMLEDFTKQAVDYLDAWQVRFDDWLVEQHEGTRAKQHPWPSMTLDFSLVKEWTAVNVEIQSRCRDLPVALVASSKWVGDAYDEWADFPELDWLDTQRAILYGLQAGELAVEIRTKIAAPASNLAIGCFDRLQREFGEVKRRYVEQHGKLSLIPDMEARLQRECPQVATAPGPVVAPAGG